MPAPTSEADHRVIRKRVRIQPRGVTMMYPEATRAVAADRIRQYRAEADAWRLARLVRAARGRGGGGAARRGGRPAGQGRVACWVAGAAARHARRRQASWRRKTNEQI